jgi:hypothetical protein
MKRKTMLTTLVIVLTSLMLWNCTKDETACRDEQAFCRLIDKEDFDGTGPIIGAYLAGLRTDETDTQLEKLADWLACQSCVAQVTILCNSCIYTLPPQSELQVDFVSKGKHITKILDILMGDPLTYRGHHD